MTWTEVRHALKARSSTVIIPVGGTEQSGPHMALGKHNSRVNELAGRKPHGLMVWPQPGRYLPGHTGNLR